MKNETTKQKSQVNRVLALFVALTLSVGCAQTPVRPATVAATVTAQPSARNHVPHYTHAHCQSPNFGTLDAIVRVANISTGGGDGSGVVIAPNVVLTAAHVLEDSPVGMVYIGSHYKEAMILGLDTHSDLALLMVGTENLEPIQISDRGPAINESVWAVGFPLALDQTTTRGEFFRYRNGGLLTSTQIDAGSSGGGLLMCEHGQFKLAGMVRSYLARIQQGVPVPIPRRSISVPADTIEAFMNLHGIQY